MIHDFIGREEPLPQPGKPQEVFETERSLRVLDNDVFIATYPKTGTTLLQYLCHLIRSKCEHECPEFEDIHQICPHTSSAWFVGQDLNAEQTYKPRLFKSHRRLQELSFAQQTKVKYISTIRDPVSTLVSLYRFRKERGTNAPNERSVDDLGRSEHWQNVEKKASPGKSIFDHITTCWKARNATNILIIPYEDLENRARWIPIIANFMGVAVDSPDVVEKILLLTTKESMNQHLDRFDESWGLKQREKLQRPHPTIHRAAAKVRCESIDRPLGIVAEDEALSAEGMLIQQTLWQEKVTTATGVPSYAAMRQVFVDMYFSSLAGSQPTTC